MNASTTFTAADGDGYELNMGRWSRRLAIPFLQFVGTADAERVLDVGCGTGALVEAVLARCSPLEAHAVDAAQVYVEYARARTSDPRWVFAVGDACSLSYPDNYFDRVVSLLVLHFVPRAADAISEMLRVAKPGATVGTAVWDVRGGCVANRMFFDTAAALDSRAAVRRARNYTRPLTRPGELTAAWRAAGFADIEEEQLFIRMEFADFEDYWRPYLGKDGPGAEYVGSLAADDRGRIEAAVRSAYLDGEPDGPRSYAALAWAVKGKVPHAAPGNISHRCANAASRAGTERREGIMPDTIAEVTPERLQAFADAWNRHDVDALMTFMTEDCVFEASAGPDACGARYVGFEAVRAGFAEVWATFPDAHWGHARHFVCGERGASEWTFTGTRADGTRVEVHGCDLFTFRDGKIALKNSYRKNRPSLGAAKP